MKAAATAMLLALSITSVFATLGLDVSQKVGNWACLRSAGYSFAIPRAWCSFGGMDGNAISNVNGAWNAGFNNVDIYMFPCRGKNPADQVNQLISGMGNTKYGMIWFDVETNPSSGCSWAGHTAASNCQFVVDMYNAAKAKGKNVGFYANQNMWS